MAAKEHIRNDRARYPVDVREIYSSLHEGNDMEQAPFETLKDIFMLAACLGFIKSSRKELPPGQKVDMRMEVFSDKEREMMRAIAVADTGDVEVLDRRPDETISGEVLDIVEEYAYGGIIELRSLILEKPGTHLLNVVDLIKSENND